MLTQFLALLAWSEGTVNNTLTVNHGYDVIVSGPFGPEVFTDYSRHPFQGRPAKLVRPGLYSTASGRYQLLHHYWMNYKALLNLPDFGPSSQDAVAIQQIRERGAVTRVMTGDVAGAITLCSNIWASLPGNTYDQHAHTMNALLAQWAILNKGVTP